MRGNKIQSVNKMDNLQHIKHVDLTRNPLINVEQIRKLKIPKLIITDFERVESNFDKKLENVLWMAYLCYRMREKQVDSMPPFFKRLWTGQSTVERYISCINQEFAGNKEAFWGCKREDKPMLLKKYLAYVKEKCPYLSVDDWYREE